MNCLGHVDSEALGRLESHRCFLASRQQWQSLEGVLA